MSEARYVNYDKSYEEKLRADVLFAASQTSDVRDMIVYVKSLGHPYLHIYSAMKKQMGVDPKVIARAVVRESYKSDSEE